MEAQTPSPFEMLRHLLMGYRVSRAIHVTSSLGIADLLTNGPRSAEDLAAAAGADAPSLFRVLRLLASEGVFAETEDGRFTLTPMAEALRRDVPGSLWPASDNSDTSTSHMRRCSGSPTTAFGGYLIACGLTGEPTAPVIGSGEAVKKNS